jgi:FMN phosphatase YigB (HAD superfamily)
MGMTLQGIFLDMYGTLTAGDRAAVEAVCRRIVEEHRLGLSAAALAIEWGNRFFAAIESANGPAFRTLFALERETLVETLAAHGVDIDPTPYCEQLRGYWRDPPLHAEVLDALGRIRLPVFIVSNADRDDIIETLARHDLRQIPFVTSECARSYKPHAGVFRAALARTGWDPHRVIHVGDSLHSDVGGAKPLGLRTGWLCRDDRIHDVGEEQPDVTFRDLMELARWADANAAGAERTLLVE